MAETKTETTKVGEVLEAIKDILTFLKEILPVLVDLYKLYKETKKKESDDDKCKEGSCPKESEYH